MALAEPFTRKRPLAAATVALMLLSLSGCPASNVFHGRLFVINSTGAMMRSPRLINDHPGAKQSFPIPDLPDGQAWFLNCRGDSPSIVVLGPIKLTYEDKSGSERSRSVPIQDEIPEYFQDDFFIEIDHNDQITWGILTSHRNGEHSASDIAPYVLAGVAGLILGWFLGRTRGRSSSRPDSSRPRGIDV